MHPYAYIVECSAAVIARIMTASERMPITWAAGIISSFCTPAGRAIDALIMMNAQVIRVIGTNGMPILRRKGRETSGLPDREGHRQQGLGALMVSFGTPSRYICPAWVIRLLTLWLLQSGMGRSMRCHQTNNVSNLTS